MNPRAAVIAFLLAISAYSAPQQVVVDSNIDPYKAFQGALGKGAVQSPDCQKHGKHITVVTDPLLKRKVFLFTLHLHDTDRCLKQDRQRLEVCVNQKSPSWQHGRNGKQFTYAWKLFLDKNFKTSGDFCHLHQIKESGAGGLPVLTLTARKDTIVLQHMGKHLGSVALNQVVGKWVQIRETITYGAAGKLEFTLHSIHENGKTLLAYKGSAKLQNVNAGNRIIRPKFGFYRSRKNIGKLRDQSLRIADLCVGEGANTCKYDTIGNKKS